MTGEVHEDVNPFAAPEDERDPVRRFRGRLTAPVTVITSGDDAGRTGMTVSSLFVAEGDPGTISFLATPTADLVDAIERTGRFVVHVLEQQHRAISEVLTDVANRAYCSGARSTETGYSLLIAASIDEIEAASLEDPLVYFRGAYRQV